MKIRQSLNEHKDTIKKYWSDPVWSKVISAIIITIGGTILTSLYILFKSVTEKVAFKYIAIEVFNYFNSKTEINNFVIWIFIVITFWAIIVFFKTVVKKIINKKNENFEDEIKQLPRLGESSTVIFSSRLASAFPGHRGLKWYDAKTAVKRLSIVFKEPLDFDPIIGTDAVDDPFWWFRAGRSMYIKQFQTLSKTKILLGIDELEINRIAVSISPFYYKCFIYVETKGEKQIGLYNFTKEDIERKKNTFGYCSEEYALLGKRPITREHYDDGATVIKDDVVETFGSKLRIRYLSEYNFIIAAKQSPFNSKKFDRESYDYFNAILKGEKTSEEFIEILENYERNYY
jgi:hypothetical protein